VIDTLMAGSNPGQWFNPHLISNTESRPQCLKCHAQARQSTNQDDAIVRPLLTGDGIEICTGCHVTDTVKHMLGRRPNFPVPNDLPLDRKGRITCLTCHYTHGSLRSEKPWIDVSWFERLSNSKRLYKTFLLRRNNREGGLCLACHDA
jgi:predicted CXXCH cytochrome family protein